jgi:hypothetical protein
MPLGAFKAALMGTAGATAAADVVLLHDTDYSNVASAAITSGITSTYSSYIFKFYNVHPVTDNVEFFVNFSIDGGSNYNATKTTTFFQAGHRENDTLTELAYEGGRDVAEGTGDQWLTMSVGNGNDESVAGELHLFNPASTTYVKNFYATTNSYYSTDITINSYIAGYVNSTSAVNAIIFKFTSGNIDTGTIKMWGVK